MKEGIVKDKHVALSILAATVLCTATFAADWPQWRGPNHNDVTPESSGWPKGWPPKRLWKKNVGYGCTSPIIVDGRLYVMGWKGQRRGSNPTGTDTVYCFMADTGRLLWKQSYRCLYQGRHRVGDTSRYGGPSSTPTLDKKTGYLYTLSIDGDLKCWDTKKNGRAVWSLNFYDKYKVPRRPKVSAGQRDYGYASSPLVQGELVITEVGGSAGTLVAFDKKTGKQRWKSVCKEPASHNAGPVPMKVEGVPCLASFGIRKLTVIRTDKGHQGETLAQHTWKTAYACNIITPAAQGNKVIVSSGHDVRRTALLEVSRKQVRQRWSSRYWSEICSPVIYNGRVYLAIGSLCCLDLGSGKRKWQGGSFGRDASCLVTAGDRKVIVFGAGRLAVAEAAPKNNEYHELARIKNVVGGPCYPHVVLSDGILCCKNKDGDMVCLSVRKR